MARHRLAIVGLGMAVTPHAKGLQDLADRVEVAWAYSPTAARRQAIAERFGFPTCDSLQTILGDDSVDSVLVLTPPNTHLDIARQVAAAGKHLLLEKPLEVSTARAEMLVAACDAAGIVLGIVLQHRFRPAGRRLRALMAEGGLGALIGCSTGIRLWRPQSYYDVEGRGTLARDGGGVLLTQGIHTLDLMLSLTGPVADVAAYARTSPVHRMETEDQVAAAVRFANGALGTIDATTAAYPGYPERIELIFERATAVLAGTELAVHRHNGTVERIAADASPGGTGADPMAFPHDYHR
ncbi:MAG: Gfo/Idh/MocA family oxidoreductase, partial [Alphaproteobacteria bacterium]